MICKGDLPAHLVALSGDYCDSDRFLKSPLFANSILWFNKGLCALFQNSLFEASTVVRRKFVFDFFVKP